MSFEAIRWILENSKTKGAQRLILVVIAEHADKNGKYADAEQAMQ